MTAVMQLLLILCQFAGGSQSVGGRSGDCRRVRCSFMEQLTCLFLLHHTVVWKGSLLCFFVRLFVRLRISQ